MRRLVLAGVLGALWVGGTADALARKAAKLTGLSREQLDNLGRVSQTDHEMIEGTVTRMGARQVEVATKKAEAEGRVLAPDAPELDPLRVFHGEPIGAKKVRMVKLRVSDPDVEKVLEDGVFGRQLEAAGLDGIEGVARWSNGNPLPADDQRVNDVRGVAFDIGGRMFTATNNKHQIVAQGPDFLRFFENLGRQDVPVAPPGAGLLRRAVVSAVGGAIKLGGMVRDLSPRPGVLGKLIGLRKTLGAFGNLAPGTSPIPNLLKAQYWGYPIVVGKTEGGEYVVARYTFKPVLKTRLQQAVMNVANTNAVARLAVGVATTKLGSARNDPRYLTNRLNDSLLEGDAEYVVGLQFYNAGRTLLGLGGEKTPLVNDGNVQWKQGAFRAAKTYDVARIIVPQQGTKDVELVKAAEKTSFGPQTVEPEAVGQFNAQRKIAYRKSALLRRAWKAPAGQASATR